MGMYRGSGDGISVAAYTGDRAVLLAFDLAADRAGGLAGPSGRAKGEYFLQNRLNFAKGVSAGTPFAAEISGGFGQVIHHKLVICDFNGDDPVVFCGSSNLAKGGETGNSDNLIAIHDRDKATLYAVEAIRLYDHFRFRSLREASTAAKPLVLQTTPAWAEPYYNPGSIRYRERVALAGTAGQ